MNRIKDKLEERECFRVLPKERAPKLMRKERGLAWHQIQHKSFLGNRPGRVTAPWSFSLRMSVRRQQRRLPVVNATALLAELGE